jgi:uncharacterized Tic20 family protein
LRPDLARQSSLDARVHAAIIRRFDHALSGFAMKRDRSLLITTILIDVTYLISFALPVYAIFGPVFGWQFFAEEYTELVQDREFESISTRLLFFFIPHVLFWIGVVCLWTARPHLAFAAGGIATGIAIYVLYDVKYLTWPDDGFVLWSRSGAYLWTGSVFALAIAGFIFAVKQWRKTRRLPMLGERL